MIPAHHQFVKAVANALRHRCGIDVGTRVVLAVSGGADSVALLRALATIAPRCHWQLTLAVGHVQHHLRDSSVDARAPLCEGAGRDGLTACEQDAAFTQKLAEQIGLPFLRRDLDLRHGSGPSNMEARARQARYEALSDMAKTFKADHVATGHHGDDQLETILMRLLRGSSVRGFAGMAWRRPIGTDSPTSLIRPMLLLARGDVFKFLKDLGQPWREDHTNADVTRLRARLRRDVLPALHAIRPDVARKASVLSQHMCDLSKLVTDAVERVADDLILKDVDGQTLIDRHRARDLLDVVLIDLLLRVLREAGVKPDTLGLRTLSPIVNAIHDRKGGQRKFELGGGVVVTITRDEVRIE